MRYGGGCLMVCVGITTHKDFYVSYFPNDQAPIVPMAAHEIFPTIGGGSAFSRLWLFWAAFV